jgi:exodeoxyribonuclease VII small subunit
LATKEERFDFEKALAELEKLVETMETGDISLEDSLKQFERGVALTRSCQKALADAEQKVQILLQNSGGGELEAFKVDETD